MGKEKHVKKVDNKPAKEEQLQEDPVGEKDDVSMLEQTEESNPDFEKSDDGVNKSDDEDEVMSKTNTNVTYKLLPESIKKRMKALRGLQVKIIDNDAKFYKELFELEIKFDKFRQDLFEKRFSIISGEYEPTAEECECPSEDESNENENQTKIEKENYPIYDENVKGVPQFWLTVFKNSTMVAETIHENDEPLLSHLEDIKLKLHESPSGYTLEFHFSENEYFTNKVLTKYYELNFNPDKDYPFDFEGSEAINCKGCDIDWKDGKNITLKKVKEVKPRSKGTGSKIVTKTINSDSFFNFFNPPEVPSLNLCNDSTIINLLNEDFELGNYIKDRIIPKATLYYTGETYDDDDDDDYEDCEEGEEEEVEEEEEE